MYYNDSGASMQQGFYNGQAGVTAYDSIHMGAQPQQIQVVHIDVNQIVTTIFQGVATILERQQQYGKQELAEIRHETIALQKSDSERIPLPERDYIAVYAYKGFGVFTDKEKLKLRTRYWNDDYQWQVFNDYLSAMLYARSGIAKIHNVPIESIAENQRLNWMCYMQ